MNEVLRVVYITVKSALDYQNLFKNTITISADDVKITAQFRGWSDIRDILRVATGTNPYVIWGLDTRSDHWVLWETMTVAELEQVGCEILKLAEGGV